MGRRKILGCVVLVVFALGAIAAASASAASPEWYECAKNKEAGKLEKGCAAEGGKGGYELKVGTGKGKAFKGKGGVAVLHVKTWLGDNTVECQKSKSEGHDVAPSGVSGVVVSFGKCVALKNKPCNSAGAKKGEIKTNPLKGELGYVEESPVNVGLRLEAEGETPIATFTCVNLEVTLVGQLIGELKKNTNTFSKESELSYVAAERIGEHEFEGNKFSPSVNIVGWASELEAIEKEETPPHVLKAKICGEYIEILLKIECTPEAYVGLTQSVAVKGENLEVKA